jgi:hypothetical protein
MVDLYRFHKKQDFTNFDHSIFPAKGNASEDIRKEIFSALQISASGKPLSEPSKIDTFMETHYSKEDILILGTSSEEVIFGFNQAKQFKHGDIDFLKNVNFDTEKAYVSVHNNAAWLSITGYFQTVIAGLILPLRHSAVLIKHGDIWKIHKSQTDWFYNTNFLLNKIVFTMIFSFICLTILVIRLLLSTISWRIERKSGGSRSI